MMLPLAINHTKRRLLKSLIYETLPIPVHRLAILLGRPECVSIVPESERSPHVSYGVRGAVLDL